MCWIVVVESVLCVIVCLVCLFYFVFFFSLIWLNVCSGLVVGVVRMK